MQEPLKIVPAKITKDNDSHGDFLKNIRLFSEFDHFGIAKLLERSVIKKYKKDKLLFFSGDKADFFYVIISGWVKLFRETRDGHESVISVLTHHDVFGKTALLQHGDFAYTAEAITDATILQIPASFVKEMAKDHQYFDDFLAKLLESQLEETNQRYLEAEHLAKMTSAQRVGCFLLRMCGGSKHGNINLQFPYEKALVAGRLGMTPETFSRSLNQLSELGVETNNAMVTIQNIEQLRARVCEHCSALKSECSLGEEEFY